jgi:hypothetical protein
VLNQNNLSIGDNVNKCDDTPFKQWLENDTLNFACIFLQTSFSIRQTSFSIRQHVFV